MLLKHIALLFLTSIPMAAATYRIGIVIKRSKSYFILKTL
jgi:hypothetical protein